MPESTPAGFCVFLSDPDPGSKICEKPDPESKVCEKAETDPESLFNSSRGTSLCGHFLSKNMSEFRLDG